MPVHHEVLDGSRAAGPAWLPKRGKVQQRFVCICRLIVVADRGLLSLDNLIELGEMSLSNFPRAQAFEARKKR